MSEARPYLEWPLGQLAEHAAMHDGRRDLLLRIAEELACRPGKPARALERKVQARLAALPSGAPAAAATALRHCLAAAAEEIAALRRRVAALEPAATPGPHAQVHLAADAPLWLVAEVRRAFRRRYHPDRFPDPDARAGAEETFKRAEAAFAAIAADEG